MKNKKAKENIIGKIIYGFTLFMPLIAVLVTCAYAVFNKNAYISYQQEETIHSDYGNTHNINNVSTQWIYLDSDFDLKQNSSRLDRKTITLNDEQNYLMLFNVSTYTTANNNIHLNLNAYETFSMNVITDNQQNNFIYYIYYCENAGQYSLNLYHHAGAWNCNFIGYSIVPINEYFNIEKEKNNLKTLINTQTIELINQRTDLNNVFYYSIDKVEESNLFNWSKNTGLYTVLNTTCTTLGINTTFIPFIFAYWLLVSLIYILYDIALVGIHIIHNKIHELEGTF